MSTLDHVRSYYEALNAGDLERIASHFTADATHYYTRLGPHEGARAIAENARWAVDERGDLLGFDFGTRGYTTIDDWTAPGERRER